MLKSIISNLFITILLVIPILLKTIGFNNDFILTLVSGLRPLLIILTVMNFIGLICLQTVAKFANYIDTKDLIEQSAEQEKLEKSIWYKIYKTTSLSIFFGLLMYNCMYLTTIFACVWWLTNHFFKIYFDRFIKGLE